MSQTELEEDGLCGEKGPTHYFSGIISKHLFTAL